MPPKKVAAKPRQDGDLTAVPLAPHSAFRTDAPPPRSSIRLSSFRLCAGTTYTAVVWKRRLYLAGSAAAAADRKVEVQAAEGVSILGKGAVASTLIRNPAEPTPLASPQREALTPDLRRRIAVTRQLLKAMRQEHIVELRSAAMPPVWVRNTCQAAALLSGALNLPLSVVEEGDRIRAVSCEGVASGDAWRGVVSKRDSQSVTVLWDAETEGGPPAAVPREEVIAAADWDAVPRRSLPWSELRTAVATRESFDAAITLEPHSVPASAAAEARCLMGSDAASTGIPSCWAAEQTTLAHKGGAAAAAVLSQWVRAMAAASRGGRAGADLGMLASLPIGSLATMASGPRPPPPRPQKAPCTTQRPHTAPARVTTPQPADLTPSRSPAAPPAVLRTPAATSIPAAGELAVPAALSDMRVSDIAGGDGHLLVLSAEGVLLSLGSNTHGQLGRPHCCGGRAMSDASSLNVSGQSVRAGSDDLMPPAAIPLFRKRRVLHIACGSRHSLVLCTRQLQTSAALFRAHSKAGAGAAPSSGVGVQLYSFGDGRSGQLGTGRLRKLFDCFEPQEVKECGSLDILAIAAGGACSAVLARQGVWVFGENRCCQLGLPAPARIRTPTLSPIQRAHTLASPQGVHGYSLSVGGHHTVALLPGGPVGCGSDARGELGLQGGGCVGDMTAIRSVPAAVQGVSAGRHHTVFWCKDGSAYASGGNDCGQLGVGDTCDRSTPARVCLSARCLAAAAGTTHSVFLTEQGLYACGRNVGQLGLGVEAHGREHIPTPLPVSQFNEVAVPPPPPPPPPPPAPVEPAVVEDPKKAKKK